MSASPPPGISGFGRHRGGSEFSHQGMSFVVPQFFLITCTYNRYGRLESKCFYGGMTRRPCAEASRHKTNPERVCAAGILYAVWDGKGGGTDVEENGQNRVAWKFMIPAAQIERIYYGSAK